MMKSVCCCAIILSFGLSKVLHAQSLRRSCNWNTFFPVVQTSIATILQSSLSTYGVNISPENVQIQFLRANKIGRIFSVTVTDDVGRSYVLKSLRNNKLVTELFLTNPDLNRRLSKFNKVDFTCRLEDLNIRHYMNLAESDVLIPIDQIAVTAHVNP